MVNALIAADRLVVPTQTDPLALHGLAEMLRTADMIERSRRRPSPRHVLPTLHDRRTHCSVHDLELLDDRHRGLVWPGAVPLDTRLRDAYALTGGMPLAGRGLNAYRRALDWLLAQTTPARQQAA
jgi:chromosome partitioning protein